MKKNIKTLIGFIVNPFVHPFAKKHVLKTFYRILRWQIVSRFKFQSIETWINNLKVECRKGDTGFTGNLYYGLMEYEDMSFVAHLLDHSDTFIDVGSNLGSYSLISGGVCGSLTYSLEPSTETYHRLLRNIKINNLDNVSCLNIGAGDKEGSFLFTNSKGPENHLIVNDNNDNNDGDLVKINVKKLDSLNFNANPTFIKIDTEGFELSVLKGAVNILKLDSMIGILIEINGNNMRYDKTNLEILNLLEELNYYPYSFNPFTKVLIKLNELTFTGNTLFIKNIQAASRKIKIEKNNKIWGINI